MPGDDNSDGSGKTSGSSDRSQSGTKKGWRDSKGAKALGAVGSSLSQAGSDMLDRDDRITPVAYRKGGKVRKTKMRGKKRAKSRE